MKRVLGILGSILAAIMATLFLILILAMPADVLVASWHLLRADSQTPGVVVSSNVIDGGRGTSLSAVSYTYQVNGASFSSSRVQAGFLSNRGTQTGGGGFARSHPADSAVTVHYDASNPAFSLLAFTTETQRPQRIRGEELRSCAKKPSDSQVPGNRGFSSALSL